MNCDPKSRSALAPPIIPSPIAGDVVEYRGRLAMSPMVVA